MRACTVLSSDRHTSFSRARVPPASAGASRLAKKLAIEIAFDGFRRDLSDHHRPPGDARRLTERRRMLPLELTDNFCFPHAGVAENQQARHAVAGGIIEQRAQPIERRLRLIEADPAVGLDPMDALTIGKRGVSPIVRVEMPQFGGAAHDHSSTGKSLILLKSIGGSSSGAVLPSNPPECARAAAASSARSRRSRNRRASFVRRDASSTMAR